MNPLSPIYVREPSVLMPQESSDFLCISCAVPVETDIPRAGEFGCNVEVEERHACPYGMSLWSSIFPAVASFLLILEGEGN